MDFTLSTISQPVRLTHNPSFRFFLRVVMPLERAFTLHLLHDQLD